MSGSVLLPSLLLLTTGLAGALVPAPAAIAAPPPTTPESTTAPRRPTAAWQWPLRPRPRVLREFSPPDRPWGPGHRGVDLAARAGQAVHAAGAGHIGYAGRLAGRGIVTVVHGRLRTTYLPVSHALRRGQRVAAGGRIGTLENSLTHCGVQNCLHWGLLDGDRYLDPLALLGGGPIRLLPVWGVPAATATASRSAPAARSGPGSPVRPRRLPGVAAGGVDDVGDGPQGAGPPAARVRPAAGDGGDGDGLGSAAASPAARSPHPVGTGSPVMAPDTKAVPVTVAGAAAGGAGAVLVLALSAHLARGFSRTTPGRERRVPVGVVDLSRERDRRRVTRGESPRRR